MDETTTSKTTSGVSPEDELKQLNCPHCGWELSRTDPIEPTEEDIEEYVQSSLSRSGRFTKSYSKLGGKVVITLRSRLTRETDTVIGLVRSKAIKSDIFASEMELACNRFYLVFQLVSIKTADGVFEIDGPQEDESLEEAHDRLFGDQPESIYSVAINTLIDFNNLLTKLVSMAEDSDFWKAAAG